MCGCHGVSKCVGDQSMCAYVCVHARVCACVLGVCVCMCV